MIKYFFILLNFLKPNGIYFLDDTRIMTMVILSACALLVAYIYYILKNRNGILNLLIFI
jgi:hypothetical protein